MKNERKKCRQQELNPRINVTNPEIKISTLLPKKSHAQRGIFQKLFLENGKPPSYTTLAY